MRRALLPLAAIVVLAATPALAHPGHAGSGLAAGLLHPIAGLDHLSTMILVGLWAGLAGGRARWLWPAAFTAAMLAGFVGGLMGGSADWLEGAILASLAMTGLAVGFNLRPPAVLGAAAIGAFALVHGWAHGQEAPSGAELAGFATGFALSTLGLHLTGLGLAALAERSGAWAFARAGGFAAVATGVALVLTG